jgi:20S proteasome alpha/beta subunit
MTQLTKHYTSNFSLDQVLELGLQTLRKITKQKFNTEMVEAAVVDKKKGYYTVSRETLQQSVDNQISEEKK